MTSATKFDELPTEVIEKIVRELPRKDIRSCLSAYKKNPEIRQEIVVGAVLQKRGRPSVVGIPKDAKDTGYLSQNNIEYDLMKSELKQQIQQEKKNSGPLFRIYSPSTTNQTISKVIKMCMAAFLIYIIVKYNLQEKKLLVFDKIDLYIEEDFSLVYQTLSKLLESYDEQRKSQGLGKLGIRLTNQGTSCQIDCIREGQHIVNITVIGDHLGYNFIKFADDFCDWDRMIVLYFLPSRQHSLLWDYEVKNVNRLTIDSYRINFVTNAGANEVDIRSNYLEGMENLVGTKLTLTQAVVNTKEVEILSKQFDDILLQCSTHVFDAKKIDFSNVLLQSCSQVQVPSVDIKSFDPKLMLNFNPHGEILKFCSTMKPSDTEEFEGHKKWLQIDHWRSEE